MAVRMEPQRFDELVADALDLIPAELAAAMDNVVILVEDRHPEDPELLGLYEGVPLTERTHSYSAVLPDRITIFRGPTLRVCDTETDVIDEFSSPGSTKIERRFQSDTSAGDDEISEEKV